MTQPGAGAAATASAPPMRIFGALALAVLAGIGGFIDTGGIVTSTQAGAIFHYALLWTAVFGFIGFAVFAEMSGRIAVASAQPTYEVMRTCLGPRVAAFPVVANLINHVLTLAVDFMGMALALQMLTSLAYRLWVPIFALGLGVALWRYSFERVDQLAALLGLTMLVVVAATFRLSPDWSELGLQLLHPRVDSTLALPGYLFAIASLLGSFMTPYQFDFYSSGAVEEHWSGRDLVRNRIVSVVGTLAGAVIALALMVTAAMVLTPQQPLDQLAVAAQPSVAAFGRTGFYLFAIGVFSVSLAASVELCLSGGYAVCQYFGWDWGKSAAPSGAPAFNLIFIAQIVLAAGIVLTGVDPIRFTLITMALAAASLPFTFVPLIVIANNRQFMGEQTNGLALNVVAWIVAGVLIVVALATPLLLVLTHGQF